MGAAPQDASSPAVSGEPPCSGSPAGSHTRRPWPHLPGAQCSLAPSCSSTGLSGAAHTACRMTGSPMHQLGPSQRLPRPGQGRGERWGSPPQAECGSAVRHRRGESRARRGQREGRPLHRPSWGSVGPDKLRWPGPEDLPTSPRFSPTWPPGRLRPASPSRPHQTGQRPALDPEPMVATCTLVSLVTTAPGTRLVLSLVTES